MRIRTVPKILHGKVIEDYHKGLSVEQLSAKYKVPPIEICNILEKFGI